MINQKLIQNVIKTVITMSIYRIHSKIKMRLLVLATVTLLYTNPVAGSNSNKVLVLNENLFNIKPALSFPKANMILEYIAKDPKNPDSLEKAAAFAFPAVTAIIFSIALMVYFFRHERKRIYETFVQDQVNKEKVLIENQKGIIHLKERELMSLSLELINKEELLKEVIKKIDSAANVKDIKASIEQTLKNEYYWKQFNARFSQINPGFDKNLQKNFPMLNSNDRNFCALLKMKLSNKEIAELLHISHESVISKKYRLKKKMNIKEDAEFEKVILESD